MTLEDFFTLTEMKNGLATLARVEELISVMQEQKASVTNNVSEAARQCSTCARTLTATENKDCLSHFVALNGLCFINRWLQEALKCGNAVAEIVIEDLVSALLSSLERLPVDREKPTASEIWPTVEQFLDHRCHRIRDQARSLLDKWNKVMASDVSCRNLENQPRPLDSKTSEEAPTLPPVADVDQCKVSGGDGGCRIQSSRGNLLDSNMPRLLKNQQPLFDVADSNVPVLTSLTAAAAKDVESFTSCEAKDFCREKVEETSVSRAEGKIPAHNDINLKGGVKENEVELNPRKDDECIYSQDHGLSTSSKPVMKPGASSYDIDPEETNNDVSSPGKSLMNSIMSCNTTDTKDVNFPKYNQNTQALSSILDAGMDIDDASEDGFQSRKVDGSPYKLLGKETEEMDGDNRDVQHDHNLEAGKKLEHVIPDISSRRIEEKGCTEIDNKSDIDLECGEIDALEVARQVAIEVEREVVDYREPLCSSSAEISSGETMDARKADLVDGNQQKLVDHQVGYEISTGDDHSDGTSNLKDDSLAATEKIEHVAGKDEGGSGTPTLTTIVDEPESKVDENRLGFDLNEDVHIEEFDSNPRPNNPVSLSAPVTVSAVKRSLDFPLNQLRFEGVAGWKGSAATSAFRSASSRRTPDGEKTHSYPVQRTSVREFDLNIAENEDTPMVEPAYEKTPFSGILYRNSSLEVSSTRAEKPKLDLNCVEDVEVSPYPSSFQWKLHHHNGDQSLSSASSSSSRHPTIRDFDLNDNPLPLDSGASCGNDQPFLKALGVYMGSKLDDPVTTITDSRMVVERKDTAYQAPQHYYANGFNMELSLPARPVLPYPPMVTPAFRYNGQQPWLYPPAYGPVTVPYMVDARGVPIVPQMPSTAGIIGTPSTAPPFLMNLVSAPSSLKGFGTSHSGLDLDSGMAVVDNGTKDAQGFRQFLVPRQNGFVEAQNAQTANSSMTPKRKEPDSGREHYSSGYKQMTLWQ